jgi:signal transduction histidine kinase
MNNPVNETVLIVDDNPINLKVIANCLSKPGYKVIAADDGPSAIELSEKAQPGIILLDVMMPGMDGYETCAILKSKKETRDIPILFLTARSETADKVNGFHVGGADYITKPYQETEVLARVRTHLTIASQNRRLQAMLAERERFMKIAAHDLRNPLSIILLLASLENKEPGADNAFTKIERAASHMKNIIDDFLCLQVLGAEGGSAASSLELKGLMEQIIDQQGAAAQSKGIKLTLDYAPSQRSALGTPGHVHQILTNYASNAIKYSPRETQVALSARQIGNTWRIEVQDQGPGVPPAERNQLFVEFGRISNKPTGGESSTKLGLAVVKRLAEVQGGAVGASFPETGGSVFWVEIPAA